jgi:predicted NAD/FAD-dependent oxidoreductase
MEVSVVRIDERQLVDEVRHRSKSWRVTSTGTNESHYHTTNAHLPAPHATNHFSSQLFKINMQALQKGTCSFLATHTTSHGLQINIERTVP